MNLRYLADIVALDDEVVFNEDGKTIDMSKRRIIVDNVRLPGALR